MPKDATAKIEKFFGQYRLREFAKGQILILNGDDTDYIYHLVKGKVKEYDVTYRGEEIILNVFKPPAFFPMSLAINKVPNPYIYEAETAIEIHQAPTAEVIDFLRANPDVVFDLLGRLYRGMDGLLGRLVQLMAGSARSRLIYELIVESARFGQKRPGGSYMLEIKESELAARAGLSRETVSREMHNLKADKLLQVRSGGIIIKDLSVLEQKLDHPS